MGLYLKPNMRGSVAIAICGRCNQKIQYDDLKVDPNNGQYYCPKCVDVLDPWRKPARKVEDISLQHPRPDDKVE